MLHIPLTLYLLLIKILGIIALFWGTNSTFAAVKLRKECNLLEMSVG